MIALAQVNDPASEIDPLLPRGERLARLLHDDEARARLLIVDSEDCHTPATLADSCVAGLDEALAIGREHGALRLQADALWWKAIALSASGQAAQALGMLRQAWGFYDALGLPRKSADALYWAANLYWFPRQANDDDLQQARQLLLTAQARLRSAHAPATWADICSALGEVDRRLHMTAEAETEFRDALRVIEANRLPSLAEAIAKKRYSLLLLDEGRAADAATLLEDVLAVPGLSDEGQGEAHLDLARADARLGQREQALAQLQRARDLLFEGRLPRNEAEYHEGAADVYETIRAPDKMADELRAQIPAEREAIRVAGQAELQRQQVRLDVALKDRENALLKASAAVADSRRLALILMLVLSVVVLGGGALVLVVRLRAHRASIALLARLAQNGREMTVGLDRATVIATLHRQLGDLSRASATTVWLREPIGFQRVGEPVRHDGGDSVAVGPGTGDDKAASPDVEPRVARCAELGEEVLDVFPARARRRPAWFRRGRAATGALQVFEPLHDGEQVIGVVRLEFADARRYGSRARQVVRTTCLYAAVALANIRAARLLGEAQVELEQERTRDMLVHTARLVTVGSMASGIVHEMSHPVGAMMLQSSNAQASLEIGEPAGANEALSGIHREARRLQNLITRLRNLCRADPPQIEEIDLLDVLEDARVLFQPQLQMARVEFVQAAQGVRVTVDAERVVLAIANIVFNAVDAMEGRDVRRVEIDVATQAGYACIRIRDTGPGLMPAQLARLFEPFYTTKPPGKGLGLGLALSVKSVSSMNGRIEATNHPDGGAVFSVCLPLAPEDSGVASLSFVEATREG